MNPAIFTPCSLNVQLYIINPSTLSLPNSLFPSGFPIKMLHAFLISPKYATLHVHRIFTWTKFVKYKRETSMLVNDCRLVSWVRSYTDASCLSTLLCGRKKLFCTKDAPVLYNCFINQSSVARDAWRALSASPTVGRFVIRHETERVPAPIPYPTPPYPIAEVRRLWQIVTIPLHRV